MSSSLDLRAQWQQSVVRLIQASGGFQLIGIDGWRNSYPFMDHAQNSKNFKACPVLPEVVTCSDSSWSFDGDADRPMATTPW